jgi:uncharacterized membrane protein
MAIFIDNLALVEVLLLLGAAVLAYSGVMIWWAVRTNQDTSVRRILRGTGVPVGAVGLATTALALWGEMTWPFPATMAGYNIFFFDALLLFGLVLTAYATCAYMGARLQSAGLFALVAGGATAFYGWTGYTAAHAFTTHPFDTLLLYAGFAMAGIFAFPTTVVIDYYLDSVDAKKAPFLTTRAAANARPRGLGTRAAQPVVPSREAGAVAVTEEAPKDYHVPLWVQTLLLLFPVFMALAAIAALWYFGTTLPGHLGGGPGAAP